MDIERTTESRYINVTENGIARLSYSRSPENIKGLYTTGLQSCAAILIVGEQGIVLIHDFGKMNRESIIQEFSFVGQLKWWSTAFYPQADQGSMMMFQMMGIAQNMRSNETISEKKTKRIFAMLDEETVKKYKFYNHFKKTKKIQYIKATNGFISINRDAQVNTTNEPQQLFKFNDYDKRCLINQLNHLYVEDNELIPGDLQYDGERFTETLGLLTTFEEMLSTAKRSNDRISLNYLQQYQSHYLTNTVQSISTTPNRNALVSDSPIRDTTRLRALLETIISTDKWQTPPSNKIWLSTKNEEEANTIVKHFKDNGYQSIRAAQAKTGGYLVLIESIDLDKLRQIPSLVLSNTHSTNPQLTI